MWLWSSNLPHSPRWQLELQHLVSMPGRNKKERDAMEKLSSSLFRRFIRNSSLQLLLPLAIASCKGGGEACYFSQAHWLLEENKSSVMKENREKRYWTGNSFRAPFIPLAKVHILYNKHLWSSDNPTRSLLPFILNLACFLSCDLGLGFLGSVSSDWPLCLLTICLMLQGGLQVWKQHKWFTDIPLQ